ncbi:hypothetical protein AGMMS50230_08150 [Spirochaetia bacterium]|nr:hypothetical protein AGMMS50230_08150 [Spirochaetia bacterium]
MCFALWLVFSGCAKDGLSPGNAGQIEFLNSGQQFPVYTSYTDIPGVTQDEIKTIEAFRASGRSFVYGMPLSAECFEDEDGMGGYVVLFCQWLNELFGLEFTPAIYDLQDLSKKLESGEVDFTGEFTADLEEFNGYFMTSPIAKRPITSTRLINSPEPAAISTRRLPRIGFLTKTIQAMVEPILPYDIEPVHVTSSEEAYQMIRARELDAFVEDGYEGEAAVYHDLAVADLLPPVYSSIIMAARKAELAAIISVVQKYLDQKAFYHLVQLYNQGHQQYLAYRFHSSLTPEELAYVKDHDGRRGNIPIPVIMEKANYPVAFYNTTENAWQGLAMDVLKEIEAISGFRFEVISDKDDTWVNNLTQLESGEASIISELVPTNERVGRFIWALTPFASDNFALLSKEELPDLSVNEISYAKVGLVTGAAYTDKFHLWFPSHLNTVEYPGVAEALAALKEGKIDLVMGTRNMLLALTNYMEEPGFKTNIIFYRTADSYFGFNKDEKILCSVMDKAQVLVNTTLLENRWLNRVFDYRSKIVRARQPYLIGFSVLMGIVIFLLIVLLQKYKESGHALEIMVRRRTIELEDRNKELENQKNAVHAAYKVKNRFLANMSHEIRTPLNAIIGLSQAEMEKAQMESRDNLASINHSGSALLSVINDLLDISNIESGEMELRPTDYSLPALINSAMTAAKLRIDHKQISLRLELDENLPVKLHGDKQRIVQILNNLLSNAIKFTQKGSIILRVGFDVVKSKLDELILIFEVYDTGIGVKNEDIERIFTDYGQTNTESSRSTGGLGMGLVITKKLTELMGGSIGVVSEYGRGSVFTARLRQGIADKTAMGEKTAEQLRHFTWKEVQGKKPCLSYARVLVVDDVPTNHAVARGIMRPYRMAVDAVISGQEAINIIAEEAVHYDAVFMDHMMPGMDGMEATKRIRNLGTEYARTIPIMRLPGEL